MVREEKENSTLLDSENPFLQVEENRFTQDLIDLTTETEAHENDEDYIFSSGTGKPSLSFFTPPAKGLMSGSGKRSNIPIMRFKGDDTSSPNQSRSNNDATFLSPKSTMRKISNATDFSSFKARSGNSGAYDTSNIVDPFDGVESEKLPELVQSTILSPLETMRKISQTTTPLKPLKQSGFGGLVGSSPSSTVDLYTELKSAEKKVGGLKKSPLAVKDDEECSNVTPRQEEILNVFRRSLNKCTDEIRDKVIAQEVQVKETRKITGGKDDISLEAENVNVAIKSSSNDDSNNEAFKLENCSNPKNLSNANNDVEVDEVEIESSEVDDVEIENVKDLSMGQRFLLAFFIVGFLLFVEYFISFVQRQYFIMENEILYHVPLDDSISADETPKGSNSSPFIEEMVQRAGDLWKQSIDKFGSFFISWNPHQPQ